MTTVFFINGTLMGSWASHLPFIKARLGVSEGEIALGLLVMAAGAIATMLISGPLNDRLGSDRICRMATIAFLVTVSLPLVAPTFAWFLVAQLLIGASNGAMDVAMNANGVAVERQTKRLIMSRVHGFFSLGNVAGAGTSAIAYVTGLGAYGHMVVIVPVVALLAARSLPHLVSSAADPKLSSDGPAPIIALPTGPLLPLALLTVLAFVCEGAMFDWSAIYLRESLLTSPAIAAAGFACFSVAMAVMRLGGDMLAERFGREGVLIGGAWVAFAGYAVALATEASLVTILGFSLIGAGVANIVPILFARAGSLAAVRQGTAVAAVATAGYGGALSGPAFVGFLAEFTSLRLALAVVALGALVVALAAPRILRRRGQPARATP
ncbi:MAG: MFS transporter [Geminicoccaceae bacterium]